MDVKEIERLAHLMQETGLTSLEITENDTKLKLARRVENILMPQAIAPQSAATAAQAPVNNFSVVETAAEEGTTVLSPTVGVFYTAATPDGKPFVEIGDKVKKGDILCVIEAMKLMNEIPAENAGTIVEICVGNGQVVEYNQPLFRILA